jgi:hypothetical protein
LYKSHAERKNVREILTEDLMIKRFSHYSLGSEGKKKRVRASWDHPYIFYAAMWQGERHNNSLIYSSLQEHATKLISTMHVLTEPGCLKDLRLKLVLNFISSVRSALWLELSMKLKMSCIKIVKITLIRRMKQNLRPTLIPNPASCTNY